MRIVHSRGAYLVGLAALVSACGEVPLGPPQLGPKVQRMDAAPGAFTVAIEGLRYFDLGTPTRSIDQRGTWVITEGMWGVGTTNCNGVAACVDAGLDGQPVGIQQDAQVIIDVIGAGVVAVQGQTQGDVATILGGQLVTRMFAGAVTGTSSCSAGLCDVQLTVFAHAQTGSELTLQLSGQVDLSGTAPVWGHLGGVGSIAVGPGTFPSS